MARFRDFDDLEIVLNKKSCLGQILQIIPECSELLCFFHKCIKSFYYELTIKIFRICEGFEMNLMRQINTNITRHIFISRKKYALSNDWKRKRDYGRYSVGA